MRLIKVFVLSMVILAGMASMSAAYEGEWHNPDWREGHDWHGSIRERIKESHRRIERGIEHGSLTRGEARMLEKELDDILDKVEWMRRDGRLNEREREAIHRDLDRLDRDITREKRDDDRRERRDDTLRFELKL